MKHASSMNSAMPSPEVRHGACRCWGGPQSVETTLGPRSSRPTPQARPSPVFLLLLLVVTLLTAFASGPVWAAENNWTTWKGPHQTSFADEKDWDPTFLNRPAVVNWSADVGEGYAVVAVWEDYVYTQGYLGESGQNVVWCLDVKTGKPVWKYTYEAQKGQYAGPKSTPVIDDGLVYTHGQDGDMLCNDARTGKLIWRRHAVQDFGAAAPQWLFASSFRIEGDLALLNINTAGIALHKKTGEVVWKSEAGLGNYATPVTFKIGGDLFAGIYSAEHLHAVQVSTGKVKWSLPWPSKYSIIAADPVFFDNNVFISTGYGIGCTLYDISGEKPVQKWQHKDMCTHFSTAIFHEGFLYGIDGNAGQKGVLKCLDPATGAVKWEKELGFGAKIAANGHFIYLNEKGTLIVVKIDPTGYQEVSRREGNIEKLCWSMPVLCRGTLYIRNNKGRLVSLDARQPGAAVPGK